MLRNQTGMSIESLSLRYHHGCHILWVFRRFPHSYKPKYPKGFPYNELLYADDMLLVGRSAVQLETLLHILETTAREYGLTLNSSKTVHNPINSFRRIAFANGLQVPKEYDTTYLGAKFAASQDPHLEVNTRIQVTMTTWKNYSFFGNTAPLPAAQSL